MKMRHTLSFELCGNFQRFRQLLFKVTSGVAYFGRTINHVTQEAKLRGKYVYFDNITVWRSNAKVHDESVEYFWQVISRFGLTSNERNSITPASSILLLGCEIPHKVIKPGTERLKPRRDMPSPDNVKLRRVIGLFSCYSRWTPRFSNHIHPLVHVSIFPLPDQTKHAFETLKSYI